MYKKVILGIAASSMLLAGCFGTKEEFTKGENLYNQGDYESLMEAKEFFDNYAKKNPNDDGVQEYIDKVNKAITEEAKLLTDEAYSKKEVIKAMEYISVAKEIKPDDKEIKKAYALIETSYNDQLKYDDFTSYLEDSYIEIKNVVDYWDTVTKSFQTGKINQTYVLVAANNLYTQVADIRKKVDSKSFELTGIEREIFRNANASLFDYVVNMEDEILKVLSLEKITAQTIGFSVEYITPKNFNERFLSIQSTTTSFLNETSLDGELKRTITDSLNFTEAYQEKLEAEKKE